jgi:hypothetical protein
MRKQVTFDTSRDTSPTLIAWGLAGSVFLPLLLQSIFLVADRNLSLPSRWDLGSFIGSALAGLVCLIPVFRWYTLGIAIVYLPAVAAGLFAYSLFFVGVVYGLSL